MVVTVVWISSCAVVVISLSVLLVAIFFLACCVCWKTGNDPLKQIYVLKERGFKKSESVASISGKFNPGRDFFTRFSTSAGSLSILKIGGSPSQHYFSTKRRSDSENELLDSTNASNEFTGVVLQIETENLKPPKRDEDALSYLSDDSKHTFYSTYPLTRAPSVAETMRSCLSQIDLDTL